MDDGFPERKLIGNSAENIVEFLIHSTLGWKCKKFGEENYIKEIQDMIRQNEDPIALKIKKMPDFVAFNEKTKQIFLIEVKYRSTKKSIIKYLDQYKKYWEGTKLIIVSPNEPYFIYIDLEKTNDSMKEWQSGRPVWDFSRIEQNIKDLFPDLKDETIQRAIKMIPKNED